MTPPAPIADRADVDNNRVIVYTRPTPGGGEGILFGDRAKFHPVGPDTGAKVPHAWSGYMAFITEWLPKIGQQGVGDEAGRSSLEDIAFRREPLGRWMSAGVPLAGIWYRARDAIELCR